MLPHGSVFFKRGKALCALAPGSNEMDYFIVLVDVLFFLIIYAQQFGHFITGRMSEIRPGRVHAGM